VPQSQEITAETVLDSPRVDPEPPPPSIGAEHGEHLSLYNFFPRILSLLNNIRQGIDDLPTSVQIGEQVVHMLIKER
jgi:hypothetical protein